MDHSSDPLSGFTTIPRLFIPGHGTTNAPQSYSATCTVPAGQSYFRLRQIDRSGTVHFSTTVGLTVATSAPSQVPPGHFGISSNYPNPFNPSTIIAFAISAPGHVKLEVFDVTGKRVATLTDGPREAGSFSIRFDASGLSSGLYIARLASGKNVSVQKMLLTK